MVSAPGKVLITGAYLVLEQPHAGLVVSTSARFYAIVRPIHEGLAPDSWSWVSSHIFFTSIIFAKLTSEICEKLGSSNRVSCPHA